MLNSQKGFTMLELMVVVGIIGILAIFSTPLIQEWTQNARYRNLLASVSSETIAGSFVDARGASSGVEDVDLDECALQSLQEALRARIVVESPSSSQLSIEGRRDAAIESELGRIGARKANGTVDGLEA